jgi:hypothetical protein
MVSICILNDRTHSEMAFSATELAEVLVGATHNDLVHFDLSAVTELDGQIRVFAFVKPFAGIHGGGLMRYLGRGRLVLRCCRYCKSGKLVSSICHRWLLFHLFLVWLSSLRLTALTQFLLASETL